MEFDVWQGLSVLYRRYIDCVVLCFGWLIEFGFCGALFAYLLMGFFVFCFGGFWFFVCLGFFFLFFCRGGKGVFFLGQLSMHLAVSDQRFIMADSDLNFI